MSRKREMERRALRSASRRLVEAMARRNVSPFTLTYSAFGMALLAAALLSLSTSWELFVPIGGLVYVAAGLLDALDGEVARKSGRVTAQGAYEDSVLDKFSEVAISIGLLLGPAGELEVLMFITGSLLVSYTRARAESLGVELAGVGFAERAERTLGLFAGTLVHAIWKEGLNLALALVGVFSYATAFHRYVVTRKALAEREAASGRG
ncbi:MAG: CDP-alcohol phosphatidyltransferase family protein [Thaumarchaeota archaeon]|nr:CDP-alcohol phosphatidyltransferase family protein [Candidatus Calditenuaceae archaeon]MDW8186854.1 CDP-alcohol phosphatidyltransferase family protein [Nitrososphaerota archaeon]